MRDMLSVVLDRNPSRGRGSCSEDKHLPEQFRVICVGWTSGLVDDLLDNFCVVSEQIRTDGGAVGVDETMGVELDQVDQFVREVAVGLPDREEHVEVVGRDDVHTEVVSSDARLAA